jgi:carbon monoxide dehydrogenase subunit G
MPVVSKSADIAAPPEKVWEAITDPSRFGEWQTIHVGFSGDAPASLTPGESFKQKVTIMGMPGEVEWTVDEADEPNTLKLSGTGPMGTKATAAFVLEGSNGATKLTYDTGFEGAALAPLAGALEEQSNKAADESLAKLSSLVG